MIRPLAALLMSFAFAVLPGVAHAERVTGSGTSATQTRSLEPFRGISVSGSATVNLTPGDRHEARLTMDDNLLPYFETEVVDGTLNLRFQKGVSVRTRLPVKVDLTLKQLDRVSISGAADMTGVVPKGEDFDLSISGTGKLDLDQFKRRNINMNVSGAGKAAFSGAAERFTLSVSGSGSLDSSELRADDVDITISGAGKATVRAAKALKVSVSGVGKVDYHGNPTVQQRISGLGKVSRMGD